MGTNKALAALISWTSGILTITSTSLSKAKGQAFIDRGDGDKINHNVHGIGFITKKLP